LPTNAVRSIVGLAIGITLRAVCAKSPAMLVADFADLEQGVTPLDLPP